VEIGASVVFAERYRAAYGVSPASCCGAELLQDRGAAAATPVDPLLVERVTPVDPS
jgi:hypothetical protein